MQVPGNENQNLILPQPYSRYEQVSKDGRLIPKDPEDQEGAPPLNYNGYKGAKKDISNTIQSCGIGFSVAITLIITVAMVGCTIAFAYILSSTDNYTSSQMLVHTGRRTREWNTANSYSMNVFGNDPHTRLYVCMKSANVSVGETVPDSIGRYRALAKSHHDCTGDSDGGWPRDIGFLRCIQKHFSDVTFHKSNLFLACLDHTEGVMVENIQTSASTLFLGSYNFVALLIVAMGVMTAFFIFTASGWFVSSALRWNETDEPAFNDDGTPLLDGNNKQTTKKIPSQYIYVASPWEWVPLAALPNSLALLWSLVLFGASMWFTYPQRDMWGDTVSIYGGASSFPGTPWTGNLCSGVTFVMSMYFASCLWEWWSDRSDRKNNIVVDKHNEKVKNEERIQREKESDRRNGLRETRILPGDENVLFMDKSGTSHNQPEIYRQAVPKDPRHGLIFDRGDGLYGEYRVNMGYNHLQSNLGTRYNTQLYYDDKGSTDMYLRMAPLLNKVFSFAWVFTDGLLFVGMINSQNSPLNENVVDIWFYITVCRGFHLAAAYFMDDVMSWFNHQNYQTRMLSYMNPNIIQTEQENKLSRWTKKTNGLGFELPGYGNNYGGSDSNRSTELDDMKHAQKNYVYKSMIESKISQAYYHIAHAGVSSSCCLVASLWCMILVLFHFINATSVPMHINSGSAVSALQISFISIMMVMDLFKHAVGFYAILGHLSQETYCLMLQITYTLDNLFRAVLIICALFPVTDYLAGISRGLDSYTVLAAA